MKKKILLVEDNEQNRYLATFLLEQKGYDVVHAADGLRGLDMAASEQPDLILLDIQLPGLDGHAVARALKSDGTLSAIPVVAVTSYAMQGDRELVFAAGAEGYIEKPINPETFVTEVEQFFLPARVEPRP